LIKSRGETLPIEVKYIDDGCGVDWIANGVVTGEEIKNANRMIYSGERLSRMKYQLLDYTDVTEFDVSNEDIVEAAKQDIEASRTNPNILIAYVGADPLGYGLGRMWEAYVERSGFETRAFKDREEALAWIKKQLLITSQI
jgi:hypothetical protein